VAALPDHQTAVERANLRFHEVKGVPGTADAPDVYHPTRSMRIIAQRLLIPALEPVYELLSKLHPAQWIVIANPHSYGARIAQEKLGLSLTTYVATPFCLRSTRKMPITPGISCPQWAPLPLKRAFFRFVSGLWDKELGPSINSIRRSLDLCPVKDIWYDWCLSPQRVIGLFPDWFAPNPGDWPAQFAHGGFTVFDGGASEEMPAELSAPGNPLVVFVAGSAGQAASTFFRDAVLASARRRWRAVLLTGRYSVGLDTRLPENVFRFDYVPLSRLLPLSSVIVHHAGLGTTSLALSARVPQIAVPFGHDQFDNTARIEQLGVGRGVLTKINRPIRLRMVIEQMLTDPSWRARCQAFEQTAATSGSLDAVCKQIEADHQQRVCVPG
jgi:rhamnosyltransferase subunit B